MRDASPPHGYAAATIPTHRVPHVDGWAGRTWDAVPLSAPTAPDSSVLAFAVRGLLSLRSASAGDRCASCGCPVGNVDAAGDLSGDVRGFRHGVRQAAGNAIFRVLRPYKKRAVPGPRGLGEAPQRRSRPAWCPGGLHGASRAFSTCQHCPSSSPSCGGHAGPDATSRWVRVRRVRV